MRSFALLLLAALLSATAFLSGCRVLEEEPESVLTIPLDASDHDRFDTVVVEIRKDAGDTVPVAVYRVALEAGLDRIVIRHDGLLQGRFVADVVFLKDGVTADAWRWTIQGGKVGDAVPAPGGPQGGRDITPPLAPKVKGPESTGDRRPVWTWETGGGDGAAIYRLRLDGEDVSGGAEIRDTAWSPVVALDYGRHSLEVQERDTAGNWSSFGSWTLEVVDPGDKVPPEAPEVDGPERAEILRPTWTWRSGGGGAGVFRHRLDDSDLSGSPETRDTAWQPASNLSVGGHTLYVQERDAAGNWSPSGSWRIEILAPKDTLPPAAPQVAGPGKTGETRPTWTWKPGGGGIGIYRHRLDIDTLAGQPETSDTSWRPSGALAAGIHTLYVQERDSAGNWSASGAWSLEIEVPRDTVPPAAPRVAGPETTQTSRPTWTWTSGGGGSGYYRIRLDDSALAGRPEIRDTAWRPDSGLAAGSHTLYVQERDAAGNWSPTASWRIQIVLVNLRAPVVKASPASPTNQGRPVWSWTGSGTGRFRYKTDLNLDDGAAETRDTAYQPAADLPDGVHTLYVQEQDSLGRWSETGQASVRIDRTPPAAPVIRRPSSPTNAVRPAWTWVQGGGGAGQYRYTLDEADIAGNGTGTSVASFTPAADLPEGSHVFRVQERDSAGNWSPIAVDTVVIDVTVPGKPGVTAPASPVEGRGAVFTFTPGSGGDGTYRYRFDGGAWQETRTAQAVSDTAAGMRVIAVQARDAAGNWSEAVEDSCHVTPVLAALAVYTLNGTGRDSIDRSGRLAFRNAPLLGEGAYINGIYQNGSDPNPSSAVTPAIAGFDFTDFSIEGEFKVDTLPATRRPFLVGGRSYRWMGFLLEPNGTVSLLVNNSTVVTTTTRYRVATWHKARLTYDGTRAVLYLDGVAALTHTVALTHGNDNNVGVVNFSNGTVHKGRIRNLVVSKGSEVLAHYTLLANGLDDTGRNPAMTLLNVPFGAVEDGAYVGGIYEGNFPATGTNISTPALTALDFNAFSIAVRVKPEALPTAGTMPLVMGGTSYRWLGALLAADGTVSLSSGGTGVAASTAKLAAGREYSVRMLYSAASGRAWLFLDGALAASGPLPTLNHGNNRMVSFSNFANGTTFKGTVTDFRIHSRF
jgi:hypothetical protein